MKVFETEENRDFLEALTDIAFNAGAAGYHSGDSRKDVSDMISWADEFQQIHQKTDWNETDYIDTIDAFAAKKIFAQQMRELVTPSVF